MSNPVADPVVTMAPIDSAPLAAPFSPPVSPMAPIDSAPVPMAPVSADSPTLAPQGGVGDNMPAPQVGVGDNTQPTPAPQVGVGNNTQPTPAPQVGVGDNTQPTLAPQGGVGDNMPAPQVGVGDNTQPTPAPQVGVSDNTQPTPAPQVGVGDNTQPTPVPSTTPAPKGTRHPSTDAPFLPAPFDLGIDNPTLSPRTSVPYTPNQPINQPDRDSLAPHKDNFAETVGTLEKEAVDKMNGGEIFAITAAILVFVCIFGFCFGRKCTLWCSKPKHNATLIEREPFSPAEQEML